MERNMRQRYLSLKDLASRTKINSFWKQDLTFQARICALPAFRHNIMSQLLQAHYTAPGAIFCATALARSRVNQSTSSHPTRLRSCFTRCRAALRDSRPTRPVHLTMLCRITINVGANSFCNLRIAGTRLFRTLMFHVSRSFLGEITKIIT
jgi:hypothetical protein